MHQKGQQEEIETFSGEDADTAFLQLMYYHREGAIAMTEDEISRGGFEPLVDLAKTMVEVQTKEMIEMEKFSTNVARVFWHRVPARRPRALFFQSPQRELWRLLRHLPGETPRSLQLDSCVP